MKYKLTADEISNLKGREKMAAYMIDLIQRDIAMYLSQYIYKRLDLAPDTSAELSEDKEWLITKDTIVKPTKEEINNIIKPKK